LTLLREALIELTITVIIKAITALIFGLNDFICLIEADPAPRLITALHPLDAALTKLTVVALRADRMLW
jgi:hypothetical protein